MKGKQPPSLITCPVYICMQCTPSLLGERKSVLTAEHDPTRKDGAMSIVQYARCRYSPSRCDAPCRTSLSLSVCVSSPLPLQLTSCLSPTARRSHGASCNPTGPARACMSAPPPRRQCRRIGRGGKRPRQSDHH